MTADKMGTPDNGFRKPYRPVHQPQQVSVRDAVAKFGDDWRLFLPNDHPLHKQYLETTTHDGIEHLNMVLMERGLIGRVR